MENELKVKVAKGGPMVISGDFKLILPGNEEQQMSGNTFFCRCGLSKNKPFCDASHRGTNFDEK